MRLPSDTSPPCILQMRPALAAASNKERSLSVGSWAVKPLVDVGSIPAGPTTGNWEDRARAP